MAEKVVTLSPIAGISTPLQIATDAVTQVLKELNKPSSVFTWNDYLAQNINLLFTIIAQSCGRNSYSHLPSASTSTYYMGELDNLLILDTYKQRIKFTFTAIGYFITALAMVSQGILAGLLMFGYAKEWEWNVELAIFSSLLIGFTAFLGKFILISFLAISNYTAWLELPIPKRLSPLSTTDDESDIESFSTPKKPKLLLRVAQFIVQVILNYITTVIAAGVFAWLAWLACVSDVGLGALLKENFSSKFTDKLADYLINTNIWLVFAIPSFIANLLSFPNINKYGLGALYSMLSHLLSRHADEAEYLKEAFYLDAGINKLVKAIDQIASELNKKNSCLYVLLSYCFTKFKPNETAINEALVAIKILVDNLNITNANASLHSYLRDQFTIIGRNDYKVIPPHYTAVWRSRTRNALALACATVTTIGFSNFFGLGQTMGRQIANDEGFANLIGLSDMFSMTIMACLTSEFGLIVGNWLTCGYERKNPSILGRFWAIAIITESLIVCGLGVTPNVFQAIYLGQALYAIIFAAIASFLMELFGYLKSRHAGADARTMKNFGEYRELLEGAYSLVMKMQFSSPEHKGPTLITGCCQKSAEATPLLDIGSRTTSSKHDAHNTI